MADFYIDQTAVASTNQGTLANPWKSLWDSAYGANAGTVTPGSTINIVAGTGPYYDATNTTAGLRVAIAAGNAVFSAAAKTIVVTTSDISAFNTAGKIVRITGTTSNDGQYTVVSVTGAGPWTMTVNATNNLVDETTATACRIVDITPTVNRSCTFDTFRNGTAAAPITWNLNGNEISAGLDLMTARYKWTQSLGNANEWYVTRADGSNPSLVQVESAVVQGNYMCASAQETQHNRGTVGSLSFVGQYGWGNNAADSLGFNTVYVRSNGVSPTALGWIIKVGQLYSNSYLNFTDHYFVGGTFSFGNGTAAGATDGSCFTARGNRTRLQYCIFQYADGQGVEGTSSGTMTAIVDHCLFYWCGHRGVTNSGTGTVTLSATNCVMHGTHLLGLLGNLAVAGSTLNIYNCICTANEAGAIDKVNSTSTFNFGGNCYYPEMDVGGAALGYIHPANWPFTATNDFPAQMTTTVSSKALLTPPGYATTPSNLIPSATQFALSKYSPLINAGVAWWGLPHMAASAALLTTVPPKDYTQNTVVNASAPTIGLYENNPNFGAPIGSIVSAATGTAQMATNLQIQSMIGTGPTRLDGGNLSKTELLFQILVEFRLRSDLIRRSLTGEPADDLDALRADQLIEPTFVVKK